MSYNTHRSPYFFHPLDFLDIFLCTTHCLIYSLHFNFVHVFFSSLPFGRLFCVSLLFGIRQCFHLDLLGVFSVNLRASPSLALLKTQRPFDVETSKTTTTKKLWIVNVIVRFVNLFIVLIIPQRSSNCINITSSE